MVVMKFGGTSVQNGDYIDQALDIAAKQLDSAPLLISSAMGKTTDALVAVTELAEQGMFAGAEEQLKTLKDNHFTVADGFLTGQVLEECRRAIDELYLQLIALVRGSSLLHECSPRSRDAILTFGELLSTTIIYHRAMARGMDAQWIDSRDCIITDDNFTSASPDFDATNKAIKKHVKPHKGRLLIAQGFISRTADGTTTTLGRGGSDYTAAIFGAALKADEVQIWTDVNGILTSDPRIVPGARTIDKITYDEAAELAFFGAKVVHPSTIQPAIRHGIPVWVKNSGEPDHTGTLISGEASGSGLRAIAGKKGVTLMNISSSRMLNAYGFLSRIFAIFNTYKTPVDLVATSEVSVSMTIDNTRYIEEISAELEKLGQIKIVKNASIICMVGLNLWRDSAFIARAFSALEGIPIEMVSLGSSDINLSCVVPDEYADQAIRTLHVKLLEETQ
jgi:aspartate kinase